MYTSLRNFPLGENCGNPTETTTVHRNKQLASGCHRLFVDGIHEVWIQEEPMIIIEQIDNRK